MALKFFQKSKNKAEKSTKKQKQITPKRETKLNRFRQKEIENRVEKDLDAYDNDVIPKSKAWKKKKKQLVEESLLMHNKMLDKLAPKGNIKFGDIDFTIDGKWSTILTFVVRPGSFNKLRPLWGIDTIPRLISNNRLSEKNIEAKILHSFERRSDEWAENKIEPATEVTSTGVEETTKASQTLHAKFFEQHYNDVNIIADELKEGASYLDLSIRVSIKAPTKDDLQDAIQVLEAEYNSIFGAAVNLVPFVCEQDVEYANMLDTARKQRGENYMLTSTELAGSSMFLTRGINDEYGSYIGQLAGEVNNDSVLLDSVNFKNLAVIYARDRAEDLSSKYRQNVRYNYKATTAWSTKVAQDALIHGNKVVEFVLNQEEPMKVGKNLKNLTAYVPMDDKQAAINLFQVFSKGFDEISAYNILVDKIKVFVEQFNKARSQNDNTILLQKDFDNLEDIIEQFYVYHKMWHVNPGDNKEDLRLLNLPNSQYPKLDDFVFFLGYVLGNAQSENKVYGLSNKLESVDKLDSLMRKISSRNGNIFGRKTNINRKILQRKSRIIFDFKTLRLTSHEALMAQFLNTFSYGEQELEEDDVVIIHGMDQMTPSVIDFLRQRFIELNERGVKVVLLYEDQDILFSTEKQYKQHNDWFINADMRVSNSMSAKNIQRYQELLHIELPESVRQGMSGSDTHTYFLNRDKETILFNIDFTH
ncbi:hypothetical protein U271_01832 [Staphylococcus aureus F70893]|uniref:hypothetical protein n=3 Tax=Staphylococcus aureus TaxID=1280 RepID=UPI0004488D4F|nr:hypothetical protein [Staphylococcus aureus]EVX44270.1 hypothetical protein U271_01832 [Staphylococcus aureus F70893]EWW99104.1 hypothetical protein V308_02025 [Staphylococcus aureus H81433]